MEVIDTKSDKEIGIIGWGAYVPRYRIKTPEIARIWGVDPNTVVYGLNIKEKAVAADDEDTATISVEAGKNALKRAMVEPKELGCVFVGTESSPYVVKPTGTTVAEAINATPVVMAADFEFACKAGTEAMQCALGLVGSGMLNYGMAIGADIAQGAPGDWLEYSAAGGGAAFIFGNNDDACVAKFEGSYSYSSDTPDFWRRPFQQYPRHAEAFTGGPAYFKHVISAGKGLMKELNLKPEDITYATFHQPNGKFPVRAGNILGFDMKQIEPGLLSPVIGNTYAGSTPLGLAAILDVAKPGERIMAVSYGSGAGSDAFSFIAQNPIDEKRNLAPSVADYVARKSYVDYAIYSKYAKKIKPPSAEM